jgi:hypothetical protein
MGLIKPISYWQQPKIVGGAPPPPAYDVDAAKFITATAITGSTADAINTFVVALKDASLWTKIAVLYPFVGNSATNYTYNLKDTGSFRSTFLNQSSSSFNDSTGVKFNGTYNTYMNTNYNITNLTSTDAHMYYYRISGGPSDTWGGGAENMDMGAYNESTGKGMFLAASYGTANNTLASAFRPIFSNNAPPTTGSLLLTNNSTHSSIYKGTIRVAANAGTSTGAANSGSITLGCGTRLQEAVTQTFYHPYFTSGSYGLASLGQHISGSDATNYHNAVQTLQTSLGRQV